MEDEPRRFRDTPGPLLVIVGTLALLGGLAQRSFGCFMSMDPDCASGSVPLVLAGLVVVVWGASFNRQR